MPSLIRFLVSIGIFIGVIYGVMFAIVFFVEPKQREMSERVPPERLNLERVEVPAAAPTSDGEEPQ